MATTRQPLKQLKDQYDKWGIYRELELLHSRINEILVETPSLEADLIDTDVNTAAKIATQLNLTNTAVNAILAKLRLE